MRRTSIEKEIRRTKRSIKIEKRKKSKKLQKFLTTCFRLGTVCCFAGLILLYGPFLGFRDWLITTAMSTMNHQYFATIFYDDEAIQKTMNRNRIIEVAGTTDTSLVNFNTATYDPNATYENEYEEAVLKRNANNNDYKIIRITNDKFNGYLAVIYDPSRIRTAVTSNLGKSGEYLSEISKKNNAFVAINGGGFVDEGGHGNGGTPSGTTIVSNKVIAQNGYDEKRYGGGIVGFNEDNVLVLDSNINNTSTIRDCVTFGPFLILNGETAKITGNAGLR